MDSEQVVELRNRFETARRLDQGGDSSSAIATLQRVLREQEQLLGRCVVGGGFTLESVSQCICPLSLSPHRPQLHFLVCCWLLVTDSEYPCRRDVCNA